MPMNDPKMPRKNADEATPVSGSSDDFDDGESTTQRRTIKLESELWPEGAATDRGDDDGVDR